MTPEQFNKMCTKSIKRYVLERVFNTRVTWLTLEEMSALLEKWHREETAYEQYLLTSSPSSGEAVCGNPEHNPPAYIMLPEGTHAYERSSCGKEIVLDVIRPQY